VEEGSPESLAQRATTDRIEFAVDCLTESSFPQISHGSQLKPTARAAKFSTTLKTQKDADGTR
jgi:hypothetical protein